MRIFNKNSEGYLDPTAGEAFSHITRDENLLRRQEAAERNELNRQKQAAMRKQKTLQMLRRLDENNGWKLSWVNPTPVYSSTRKETRHEKNACND